MVCIGNKWSLKQVLLMAAEKLCLIFSWQISFMYPGVDSVKECFTVYTNFLFYF